MATVAPPEATPAPDALDQIHAPPAGFVRTYIFSLDAKVIGIQYLITSAVFFIVAGLLAEIIRTQLLTPQGAIVSPSTYNAVYTMHGTAMVWFVIIPLLTGAFGNYVMPMQIGARDVAFPWLNLISFWIFPVAGMLLFGSFLIGAPNAGWTEYPPISLQGPPGTSMWIVAVFLVGISSTLTGINFTVTILKMRAPGMTFTRMPLFVWAQLATAPMLLIATTALNGALGAMFLERTFGIPFFDPRHGGSPILWQHMFWFYSHPAVYIMILPAFGMISEILPTFARKPIFGYKMVAFSTVTIALLSFSVWAHHMFTSGLAPWLQLWFMIITMLIAIPTGIKIFSWMATLWGGAIWWTTAALFATGFIITFTCGGLTGFFLAAVPADYHEHGTYFLVAHIHYVLYGGSMMGLFGGFYYWFPKMSGRMLDETLGKWHFWLTFAGFNATFMPMHALGLLGMPRRVAVYEPQFQFWNVFASISSYLLAASILIFAWNIATSLRRGKKAGPNPWGARTLEWMIDSPPPYYNFATIPAVLAAPYDFGNPLPYIGLKPARNAVEATPTSTTAARWPTPTHLER
ncbi:MAG: cytochrome c oxidase, subunit [Candidatus Eremiobacteraeota bacterium]|nr:cytochrome c oxidase, subunit [Candidatus Eremiobacteraeota bacterium]